MEAKSRQKRPRKSHCTMTPERAEKVKKRIESVPKVYRGIYQRAVEGRGLRAAIKSQCLECVCWQREEVKICSDSACPLYAVRPYQEEVDKYE
ncbi:MAG TPA: hypothetical protein VLH56_11790 [Dissulfurispiraceae bacterium]|nr:hypothetical protein [Dissulfurispiraceae bacterium]